MMPEKLDKPFYIALGKLLRTRRLELGYSLEEVANRLNSTKKTISRYETAESRIKMSTLQMLSSVLDFDQDVYLQKANEQIQLEFPDLFSLENAELARTYLKENFMLMAMSGSDYNNKTDEEVVEMANFLKSQNLQTTAKFKKLFGKEND
ncbi:helix-turn-helix domain-containing protein [Culicoidibacter larvae]|uniref:Helix-turn-helix domain-containing protein n=1 Tax=Culicoidibacter larvae TaxID=2579976 RepID=A0A5R8Q9J2_9FIRM|nr:helix-turn-helix transcriptional regulator [Culicoidibacter larvae]TLG72093.1 helix-turn-helix domain-containing protein [Culicoidibacter larvae]